jgi:hypothetical protein
MTRITATICIVALAACAADTDIWNAPDACRWFTRPEAGWHSIGEQL